MTRIVHSAGLVAQKRAGNSLRMNNLAGLSTISLRNGSAANSALEVIEAKGVGAPCRTRTCDLLVRSVTRV